MEQGTILLILNLIFIWFILMGFLSGLRGIKKTSLRFVFVLTSVVLALIITPLVTKSIMQIQITFEGEKSTINDVLLSYINSSAELNEFTSSSPTIKSLIEKLPLMIGNVVVFDVLLIVLLFLTWIIYLILASVFIKDKKIVLENGKEIVKKEKKHKLLGGVLGVAQALLIMFFLFLPATGIIGLVNDLSEQTVQAETQQEEQSMSPSAKLINDNLPTEVKKIFNAYDDSAISVMSGLINLDDFFFNSISTVKVNNIDISLRDETINIAKVYDNVEFLFHIDFSNIQSLKLIDYDKLVSAVDYIFNSNLLTTALPELTNYGFDKVLQMQEVQNNQDYKLFVESIKDEINYNDNVNENLKVELQSIIKSAKIFVGSELIDEIPLQGESISTTNFANIIEILTKDNKKVFDELIDEIFNSKVLNKGVIFVLNYGLDYAEELLQNETSNAQLSIGRIDIKDSNVALKKAEVKTLLSAVINLSNELISVDFEQLKNDYRQVFDLDLPAIATNIGSVMNVVQKMTIFESSNIYNNIVSALNETKYNEFIDFEVLKQDNIWLNESEIVSNVLQKIIDSGIVSYVSKDDDGYYVTNENITNILNRLTVTTEIYGENKTLIRQIIEPLFDSKTLDKVTEFGFEQLNDIINNLGKEISPNTVLGEINYSAIHTESEKLNILNFIDNVAKYVKLIDISEIKNDPFTTILDSNLTLLGSCMDSLKNTALFGDTEVDGVVQKGIYSNLIDALSKTEYSKYINFDCFVEEGFSFNTEFAMIEGLVDSLLDKKIVENNTETSLIEYIVKVGDWNVIFKQIDKTDVSNIFTPLMESKIFEPLGVMVVNKLNEQIKSVVGEYGDMITTVIEHLDKEEIEQVIDVLGSVTEIVADITAEDFNVGDFITGESGDKLGSLLNDLQDNANNQGVFEPAYDAMVDFIENDEKIGAQVGDITKQYPEGQIDWLSVIQQIKG